MSARTGVRLQQFGYDQLGVASAVTVPQTGAIADDYVLGPSDQLLVSLRGQENSELRAVVNRDGQIILPRLSPIPAAGRTLGDFRNDLQAAVRRAYVATDAYASVSRLRQISVMVTGQVNDPGQRLLTGLSSVIDALQISGGVKKTGSLRDVRILRNGHEIHVDLYNVLTASRQGDAPRLADGDRILVPALGPTVAVMGLVRQPGIYELMPRSSGVSVRALLNLAGGQEVRGRFHLSILRIQPNGQTRLTPVSDESELVHDSEILSAQLGADQTVGQAVLAGGTSLAGNYPVAVGGRLSDLLKAPGALGPTPYTPFGIIVRKDPSTQIRGLEAFTPVAVLGGREDMVLLSDDIVRILSVNEERLLDFVVRSYLTQLSRDRDQIRNPLQQVTSSGGDASVVRQLENQSGINAELENPSSVPADIQRRDITSLLDVPAPGSELALKRARLRRERADAMQMQGQAQGIVPSGGTGTGIPGSYGLPNSQMQLAAAAAGSDYAGATGYPSAAGFSRAQRTRSGDDSTLPYGHEQDADDVDSGSEAKNFTQQSVPAGGFALNREVQTFGQLSRQLSIDPLVLVNFLIDHRARLDGAVRGPGSYLVGPNSTLGDLVQAAGGTLNWADDSGIELISTVLSRSGGKAVTGRRTLSLESGKLSSYLVQPRDQFRFNQVSSAVGVGSVTVQGEVTYPGTFTILRGEHLSDLLARAGGLTSTAYPYGTVYLRRSAAQAERQAYSRAADEVQDQLMIAMTRVGTGRLDPNTFTSMQAFVTELRNHQALGRVSFVADPKVLSINPARDPLLETGDVIYIPPRPSTVAVLGQVLQPGNFVYRKGATIEDYLERAGGYSTTADESHTYIVLPDGEARRVSRSWLNFDVTDLQPGTSIVVPRDVTPLDLRQTIIDVSQIFSQFAVSIASIAVLSKQ